MKFSFSRKLFSKAARAIKGDHIQVFPVEQLLSSHKQNLILSLTTANTAAALHVWPLPLDKYIKLVFLLQLFWEMVREGTVSLHDYHPKRH